MKYLSLLSLVLFASAAPAHAQLYKWVGADGKITYSDIPPPASAKQVETKSIGGSGPSSANLPYELAQAVKTSPVTLYTTSKCPACDEARKLLGERGIPFSEKTVSSNDDIELLRKLSGAATLPVLTIGRNKERGFEPGAWNASLTAAGYPTSSQLPKNYSNGKAEAAVPVVKAAEKAAPAPAQNSTPAATAPAAPLRGPGGFQF